VAPNTDGDEEEQEVEAAEDNAVGIAETTSEESGENARNRHQHHGHSYHHSIDTSDGSLLADFNQSAYGDMSLPTFDSTSDLPSIHDVLNSHISPAHTAQLSDQTSIARLRRTASASDALQGTNITGWHASPTSNPQSSPHVTKKSPFESIHNISPFANSTFSPNASLTLRWPVTNAYEASLLHHYMVYCTGWIDVCDARRHFAIEVPKRAAHFPVILNGLLGLAARHLWLMEKTPEDHSQPYVDQCLQALIVALEDPLAHWDENFLAAVILLRLHEEMGDADEQCHHFGMSFNILMANLNFPTTWIFSHNSLATFGLSPPTNTSTAPTNHHQEPLASSTAYPPSQQTAVSVSPRPGSPSANTSTYPSPPNSL
tara:strand:+ start:11970 stop:13088 length:1119 start_codon:yes stop_codon:yes gene_type:complete